MAAEAAPRPVTRLAEAAMRRAGAAYRTRLRAVARAMPADSAEFAVEVFDALQRAAFEERGWRGLTGCWVREARSLAHVRLTMTDDRSTQPFHGITHDLRDAWRAIRRAPGAPLIIVLTLAIGVGMNTAVFSVVDALLFKQLPYADANRLVRVAEWPKTGGNFTAAPVAFLAWRERARTIDRFEARISASFVHLGSDGPEEELGARVTHGYFELLGVRTALGRTFIESDAVPGAPCHVIVSHRMWVRRLAGDPSAIGRGVAFAGRTCTLVGVLPADSVFDRATAQVYAPLTFEAAFAASNGRQLTTIGRMAPGVSLDEARAEMSKVAAVVNATRGRSGEGWTVALTPWRDVIVRADSRTLAWTLFGAVSVVLLVACVNVAGLSLARSVQRHRERAVRLALGAGRWRALRALAVEGLLLAAAGELAAIVVGQVFLKLLTGWLPPGTVPPENIAMLDGRALAFASAVSIAAALACATAPAWRGARSNVLASLRGGRGTAGSRSVSRFHAGLLIAEIALAMVLVTGASLLTLSFSRLVSVDPGFRPDRVLTMRVALPVAKYAADAQQSGYFDRALSAIRQVSGVERAAAVTSLPLGGWLFGTPFSILEHGADAGVRPSAHIQVVSEDYFSTLGIPLVSGRDFGPQDKTPGPPVTIVNETFARKFLVNEPAVGRHVVMEQQVDGRVIPVPWEIVGVIRSVKTYGLSDDALAVPEIYVPYRQAPTSALFVAIESRNDETAALVPAIRAALQSVDPEVPAADVLTMAERVGVSVRTQRFRTALIGAFALMAAALACVGVFGVRSRAVAARRREMGIRLAMGAVGRDLTTLVIREGMTLVAIGLAIGLAASVLVTRALQQWLFATPVIEPRAIAAAIAALGGAALVASWLPARGAARVDPLTVLRDD